MSHCRVCALLRQRLRQLCLRMDAARDALECSFALTGVRALAPLCANYERDLRDIEARVLRQIRVCSALAARLPRVKLGHAPHHGLRACQDHQSGRRGGPQ